MSAQPATAQRLLTLGSSERQTAEAVFDRLFPADEYSVAASDLGVLAYVDRALAGPDREHLDRYRNGLRDLDQAARHRFGAAFAACSRLQQDELLESLERGTLDGGQYAAQTGFFALLQKHLREGLFADPLHGGNRDKGGWRFLGHPGIWLASTAEEQVGLEPATRDGAICSLIDIADDDLPAVSGHRPTEDRWQREAARDGHSDRFSSQIADVIIVGVGAVGGLVAPMFTDAGLYVVGLEAGGYPTAADYAPDELSWTHYGRGAMGQKFLDELPSWRRHPAEPTQEAGISLGRMVNGVGGSVIRYAGWLRRFHPYHFRHLSYIRENFGEQLLPTDATLSDWPISYHDLEPYYDAVERIVGVAGDDRNPFVPRGTSLPMPPLREFRAGEMFRDACEHRGLHPHAAPVGVNSVPYNGLPATAYSAWSAGAGFGPFASDRWNPGLTSIPHALASGRMDLRTNCRVVRILTGADGAATGVEYVDGRGQQRTQMARAVILSSYTFEAVRLLLLSRDSRHPDGVGNANGQVGQHFMAKMFGDVHGIVPEVWFNKHTGPAAQAVIVDDFLAEGRDYQQLGFVGGATLGCENQFLPLFISREPLPPDTRSWGKPYKDHLRQWQHQIAIRIQPDALSYRSNFLDLDPRRRDRSGLGLPLIRITYDLHANEQRLAAWAETEAAALLRAMGATRTWNGSRFTGVISSHDLGGARMGSDLSVSVVDENLGVHDTPGLYVFSGATFPTCPGINPTLTLWALCARAADRLIQRLGDERAT